MPLWKAGNFVEDNWQIVADDAPVPANAPPPIPGRVALGPVVPDSFTIVMVGKQ